MDYYTPEVGARGYFDLLPPFASKISKGEQHTLKGVDTIRVYIARNENVKDLVYSDLGEDIYKDHVDEDMPILALQSDRGYWVYVPASHVKSYPIVNGVPYRALSIVAALPALKTDIDLTDLTSAIEELIKSHIGVTPRIRIVENSRVAAVSSEAHIAAEAKRALTRAANLNRNLEIARLNQENELLRAHIRSIEKLVKP